MSEYQYPDKDDKLTAEFMANANYSPIYWEKSEALVLKHCFSLAFPLRKKGVRSADVGCGIGRLLRLLAKRSDVVIGIEPSHERSGNAALTASELSNVVVANTTAEALPSEYFDVVLCSHVFQHINFEEQDKLAANISRILKLGGVAVITTTFNEGEQSKFTKEYWRDEKRICDSITAEEFNETYEKNNETPVQLFSNADLLKHFENFDVLDFGGYHFLGVQDVKQDALRNKQGNLAGARDAYYVLKKAGK